MANEILNVNPNLGASVDQFILDAERAHKIINGSAFDSVQVEDGSYVPTLRRAMLDNLYYKTPPIPWNAGTVVREFNQLYSFTASDGDVSWWYAPGATQAKPVTMGASPVGDINFRVFLDTGSISQLYAPINSPFFTGNARVPTPAEGDDSFTIVNSTFVKSAIAKAIEGITGGSTTGKFEDLEVTNNTKLNKLEVAGKATFKSQIDGTEVQMLINTIRLMNDTAKIDFSYNDPNLAGKLKSLIRPYLIESSAINADTLIVKETAQVGNELNPATSGNAFSVYGNMVSQYQRITGNSKRPVTDALLIVDGRAEIKDLKVTGTTTGVAGNVDGTTIKPIAVETDNIKAKNVDVATRLTVAGTTNVKDLNVTGTVTGITFPSTVIDGKDIKPRSVAATADSKFDAKVTVKDLVVTGTVTGITADVSGKDITPRSVGAAEYVNVGTSLSVAGQATVAQLKVNDGKVIYNDTPTTEAVIDLAAIAGGTDGVGKYLSVAVGLDAGVRKLYQNPFPGYAVDVKVFINPLGSSTDSYESGWGYAPDDKDSNKMKMFGVRGMRQKIASGTDAGDWIVIQVAEGGAAHKPELVGGGNSNVNEAIKNTGAFQIRVTRLFKDAASTPAVPK